MWHGGFARSVRDNVIAEIASRRVRIGGMVVLARALGRVNSESFECCWSISVIAA